MLAGVACHSQPRTSRVICVWVVEMKQYRRLDASNVGPPIWRIMMSIGFDQDYLI